MRARYSRTRGYVVSSRRPVARQTIRTNTQNVKFGPMAARYFGMLILVVLAVVMLTRSSSSSTEAYAQKELRKEVGKASQEIEQLKLEAKRAQTIQEIQNTASKEGMQPIKDAEFVEKGQVAGVSTEN
ncbi:hypothetical protein BH11PAT4_BH11PAT4_7940 [soil metagenome]